MGRGRTRTGLLAHVPLLRLALTVLLLAAAGPAAAEEAVQVFSSALSVARDGTVHAEETMHVRAEGNQIRRGIYRDVSTTFEDAEGRIHSVGLAILGVTRDGRPEPYHTERYSDFVRIFIGAEEVFLDTGSYTYVLTYETDRQVRWFDGRPELFWNVTGNDWGFPIDRASVVLKLAGGEAPVRWTAYTGRIGERGTDFEGGLAAGNVLSVSTTRRLAPGEGFSIVAELPPTAVDQPTGAQKLRYFLRDYAAWLIGGGGLLLVLGYYLWAWNKVGRDPKGGTIIPLFHPPEGISAALASYIRNWGFGGNAWKAFTASALSLAVRGLLVFDQEGKDLVFERTAQPADAAALSAGEKTVLDWVEAKGGRAEISKANGKSVAEIGQKFQKSVREESGGRHFKRNLPHFIIGVLLSLLVVAAIMFFGNLSQDEFGIMIGLLFIGIFVSIFLVPIVASLVSSRSGGAFFGSLVALVAIVGVVLYFAADLMRDVFGGAGGLLSSLVWAIGSHALPFAVVLVFPLLNGIFYYLLRAPTPEGRPVMDQIEGFEMYMETAESGRLNIENAPEITTERFESLLPYAVALGVERPWANAFESALRRAYPNDPDPMSHYHARWRRGGAWSSGNFGRSIASAVSSATSAMSSAIPRSSSGSSGFSGGAGGGGGGRGGGGW